MLIVKKTEKKRLIAYIVIIAVMFAGTILFVYKNYSFNSKKPDLTSSQPGTDELPEPSLFGNDQAGEEKVAATINKENLDTEVLNSPKFKSLKDNSVDQSIKSKSGAVNPFKKEE